MILCEVQAVSNETADVKQLVLRPLEGGVPAWNAGAHVRVVLPTAGDRAYSLVNLPEIEAGCIVLGVLLEPAGDGGSAYMHSLAVGDHVEISPPLNRFDLGSHDNTLLIAGGIGITPLLSMTVELAKSERRWQLHYSGRTEESMAFVPALQSICGKHLILHHDDQATALNITALLEQAPAGTHAYVCGPSGMIEAVKSGVAAVGWSSDRFHYELFSNDSEAGNENAAFDVEIHATGQVVHVPADKTIIEALEEAGLDPLYDCQRGDCGICQSNVIDGIPEHRDLILTDQEKASNSVMQICVSRARTPKLVIDL